MGEEGEEIVDKRQYARVDARLPLDVRLIDREQRQSAASNVSGVIGFQGFQVPPEIEDKQLADWLKMLDAKLDAILRLLVSDREGVSCLPYSMVNICGGGMRFSSPIPFSTGDLLEMKILLPLAPPISLHLYGEVVTVGRGQRGDDVSVRFVDIDDRSREEIVRFVFEKQRDILRKKRE
jgi:hypothetical protein